MLTIFLEKNSTKDVIDLRISFHSLLYELVLLIYLPKKFLENLICDSNKLSKSEL